MSNNVVSLCLIIVVFLFLVPHLRSCFVHVRRSTGEALIEPTWIKRTVVTYFYLRFKTVSPFGFVRNRRSQR